MDEKTLRRANIFGLLWGSIIVSVIILSPIGSVRSSSFSFFICASAMLLSGFYLYLQRQNTNNENLGPGLIWFVNGVIWFVDAVSLAAK